MINMDLKNSNKNYEKNKHNFIRRPYAEGLCVKNENDIAGILYKYEINTIYFGVTGTGTLVSLAILREFGSDLKPKNIFYLYFEGNDLDDLNYEKNETNLNNYLNPNYKINYINRYNEIKIFLKNANQESEKLITNLNLNKPVLEKNIKSNMLDNFKAHLKILRNLVN